MANGYMGRILNVDLSRGTLSDEVIADDILRNYVGGYGVAARLLYERMPAGADPLGPENLLAVFTGPLTGSPSIEGNRFVVCCKSPLTGGWGDANCGGTFGPAMKAAGYDGVIFSGISDKPVYLLLDDGEASLQDAGDLWGQDANEAEEALQKEYGGDGRISKAQVAVIGQAGENLSYMACVMNDYGRAAGRSGVGAVMGSKKVKAIVARGEQALPMLDADAAAATRRRYIPTGKELADQGKGGYDTFVDYGTIGITGESSYSGDGPIKNWGGRANVDFKEGRNVYEQDMLIETYQDRKYGCWRCTMSCGGHMSVKEGPLAGTNHHKVEYETAAAFGLMNMMTSFPHLLKLNELCNRYGFDTISAGVTTSFAVECFEEGLITTEDTGGLELAWGDADSLITLLEMMAHRKGIGDILADGVKVAAEKIGKGSEQYAMHVGGSEVAMHDPKFTPGLAPTYKLDATPGRHTQGGELVAPPDVDEPAGYDAHKYDTHADWHKWLVDAVHVVNSSGVCLFAWSSYPHTFIPDFMKDVTGHTGTFDEMRKAGERIAQIRHAFNLREGINPVEISIPGRIIGDPAQTEGNMQGITIDIDMQTEKFCKVMGWDGATAVPSRERLESLGGLEPVIATIYG